MTAKSKAVNGKKKGKGAKAKVDKARKKESFVLGKEISSILLIAVGIILAVTMYTGYGTGFAGDFTKGLVNGLFGFGANFLPFIIIGAGVYIFFEPNRITLFKFSAGLGLFICFISFAHVLSYEGDLVYANFNDYIKTNYSGGSPENGGLLGAVFGNFLIKLFDVAGTFIFLTAALLIFAIMLTGKSVFKLVYNAISGLSSLFGGSGDEFLEDEEEEYYQDPPKRQRPQKETKPLKPPAKIKAPVFTINERAEGERTNVMLPQDVISEDNRSPIVIKGYDSKKITDILTLEPTPEKEKPAKKEQPPFKEPESEQPPFKEPEPEEFSDDIRICGNIIEGDNPEPAPIPKPKEEPERRAVSSKKSSAPVVEINTEDSRLPEAYEYHFPPIDLLLKNPAVISPSSRASILENSRKLESTLKSFNVEAKVIEVSKGPAVTRYELSPGQGVKVSKISGLADDLALNLAASGIRIEAPIPGKAAVGIEVPNKEVTPVYLREVIEDDMFKNFPSKLAFAMGKDIAGNTVVTDLADMPHLLIAGATGSGKSVCVNTLITSIIYKSTPEEVKLLMVDPKVVELSIYNGIPHLLIPVVTDPKKAAGALNWAVREMIARYDMFAKSSVRDLKGCNAVLKSQGKPIMPQIVIIIDELADLMMAAPGEVEDSICRLAQMARAAGLHLIIATQRPSVDVITGLIKANVPSRLAFSVSSGTDSRTILDMVGAEKLLGKGDMLFSHRSKNGKPMRVQGAFISDKEVESIVNYVKKGMEQEYDQEMIDKITAPRTLGEIDDGADEFLEPAIEFVIEKEKASASMLQRKFRIGYNRASNIIDELEARGIVGQEDGSKPRKVLMTMFDWEEYKSGSSE